MCALYISQRSLFDGWRNYVAAMVITQIQTTKRWQSTATCASVCVRHSSSLEVVFLTTATVLQYPIFSIYNYQSTCASLLLVTILYCFYNGECNLTTNWNGTSQTWSVHFPRNTLPISMHSLSPYFFFTTTPAYGLVLY